MEIVALIVYSALILFALYGLWHSIAEYRKCLASERKAKESGTDLESLIKIYLKEIELRQRLADLALEERENVQKEFNERTYH